MNRWKGWSKGRRREEGREGGREEGRKGGREREEGGREGGREEGRKGGGREEGREGEEGGRYEEQERRIKVGREEEKEGAHYRPPFIIFLASFAFSRNIVPTLLVRSEGRKEVTCIVRCHNQHHTSSPEQRPQVSCAYRELWPPIVTTE